MKFYESTVIVLEYPNLSIVCRLLLSLPSTGSTMIEGAFKTYSISTKGRGKLDD